MPDQVQLRGGTASDNDNFTGAAREVTVDTTNKTLRVHDGVTAGGSKLAAYDQWGRLQVEDPENDSDVANKQWVEGHVSDSANTQCIDEVRLDTSGSFDFTDIPATYRHLVIKLAGRSSDSATNVVDVNVRFNNDTGANYDRQMLRGFGANATASESLAQTFMPFTWALPGANAPADVAGSGILHIPDYADTTFHKTLVASFVGKTASHATLIHEYGGYWRSTAAINRITITTHAGTFAAGSIATLYGMKGI